MDLINQAFVIIELSIFFLLSTNFIFILAFGISFYHILLHFLRDRKYIKALKKYKDPQMINLEDLKDVPLVNILVPAWKEGKLFEDCLSSINNLKYPNLKIIMNAGGNEETIKIANSFKANKKYTILKQGPGGKMKALNECLNHVIEGIIYSIDADVILTDEILLRMIYPIVNENENVTAGGVRPLASQANKTIVKYVLINRCDNFKYKFSRYRKNMISGPNSCFKYDVVKAIGKFPDDSLFPASDRFRATIITSKGFKIYWLSDYRGYIYTKYPNSVKEYFFQEFRWRKNALTNLHQKDRKKIIIKFIFLFLISLYILIFPLLLFINFQFVLIDLMIITSIFYKKIRKYIFLRSTVDEELYVKFGVKFFFYLLLYIYIDVILTIYLGFDSIFGKKSY